jgi:hypothetical protein
MAFWTGWSQREPRRDARRRGAQELGGAEHITIRAGEEGAGRADCRSARLIQYNHPEQAER